MIKLLLRIGLIALPIFYMMLIWVQSANFNPGELEYMWDEMFNPNVILFIGAMLELAHLIEFGILYFLIILAFLSSGKLTTAKEVFAIIVSVLFAASDEIHQYFVPYRSFSIFDMVKNTIGIWVVWYLVRRGYYSNKPTRIGSLLRGITTFSKRDKTNVDI